MTRSSGSPALNYIAGEFSGTPDCNTSDPSNGEAVGEYASASQADVNAAVIAARDAFERGGWHNNPRKRAAALLAMADALAAQKEPIVAMAVRESGKRTVEISHEFDAGVTELRYYAGLARTILGRTQEVGEGTLSLFTREPIGVVAVIVPWNAPITLLVRSLAPVLAAGCTAVIKPAAQTTLTNDLIMRAFAKVEDLPSGVINAVNDRGIATGKALVEHGQVDAISFTGSHRAAANIVEATAHSLKRLNLELGGKAPAIICSDADLEGAVAGVMRGAFAAAGQMCTAVARVVVHDDVHQQVSELLAARFRALRVGPAGQSDSEMGPLIDRASQARLLDVIETHCAGAIVKGVIPEGLPESGHYLSPTLIETDDLDGKLVQDELFGPIVTLERFGSESEALAMANATQWGLAASVWSADVNKAFRMARSIKAGTVWLNAHNRLFAEAETGGYKLSGIGRLHGVQGLDSFLETKHIFLESGFSESGVTGGAV